MFNGIIGHEAEKAELTRHLHTGRLSHAYLFTGLPGTGKAMTARAFARSILCEEATEACGQCRSCRVFDNGTHPDFLWINESPSIKVQSVRELLEFVMTRPVLAERKIVVIDDADTLTIPAQNKLLKIFEQPPGYAVIILVSGQPEGLIDTVKSRGYEVAFKPLATEEIVTYMNTHLGADPRWVDVARFSRGSLRRALDGASDPGRQLLSDYPESVCEAVRQGNPAQLIRLNRMAEDQGIPVTDRLEYLLTWLRDISILKKSRQSSQILYSSRIETLLRQSNYFSLSWVVESILQIDRTREYIQNHVNASVVMNHCLLKIQEAYDECSGRNQIQESR